ncbi:MAG TPA: hypothetical protein VHV55_00690 [Pirellulales bacterium]|jgi:hypothetical protein|nr:hypothetical protein [Pirellulales bacterium]
MNSRSLLGRNSLAALAASVLWLGLTADLHAAPRKGPEVEKPAEQGYMLAYVVTGVAVTLGVAAVCFPSQRKDEVEFDEEE